MQRKFNNLNIFIEKFRFINKIFSDREYRTYLTLLFLYSKTPRYKSKFIRFGKYTFYVPDCLSFIFQFKEIFVNNIYSFETESTEPIIFDCGANVGTSCLYFSKYFPKARITAFEADKTISEILKNNLEVNKVNNVEIINKAVWIDNKGIYFIPDGADGGSISKKVTNFKIDSIRLRDCLTQKKKIDLLKMDIEGAETEVLLDCEDLLFKVKFLFVEYHAWRNTQQNLDLILAVLSRQGFKYYIETNTYLDKPFISKQINNHNLLLNIFASRAE